MFHGLLLPWGLGLVLLYLLPMVIAYWVGPEPHVIAKGTRLFRLALLAGVLELLTWV